MAIIEADAAPTRARPEDLAEALRLEQANLTAFPSLMLHFDGAWLTRLSPGNPARRVNSLNIYDPADDHDAERRLAQASARFRDAGIPVHLRWTPLVPEAVDDLIDRRGWERYAETEVWTREIGEEDAGEGAAPELPRGCRIVRRPLVEWLRDFAEIGGTGAHTVTEAAIAALRASLEKVPAELLALSLLDENDKPLAALLGVFDGTLLGLFDVATDPGHRRRGLAAALVREALGYGARAGATQAWLQVVADNHPARRLYAGFGFSAAYRYHYCRPPAGPNG